MQSEVFFHVDPSPAVPEPAGMLSGKRVAVQSLLGVRNWPCGGESKALRSFVPLEDATVVQRLRSEGALLVGNTAASELGLGLCGDGTARAVSEGHADVALMVDTLGEARMAASLGGLFGFKPSWGRVSRFGLMGLVPSMECCSLLAANPADLVQVFRVIEGMDERDPSMVDAVATRGGSDPHPTRPAVTAGVAVPVLEVLTQEERNAFSQALSRLEKSGVTLREVKFEDWDLYPVVHQVVGSVEASSSCGKYDGVRFGHRVPGAGNWNEMYLETRRESFGPLLKTFLFQGAWFQFENYPAFEDACRVRSRLAAAARNLFQDLDVMLLPTRCTGLDALQARSLKELYRAFSLTLPASVTGQPALSLPGFFQCGGRDLGLQAVGPYLGDEMLLAWAQSLAEQREGTA